MIIDFDNVTEIRFCTTCKSKTTHEKKHVSLMDADALVCTECDSVNEVLEDQEEAQ